MREFHRTLNVPLIPLIDMALSKKYLTRILPTNISKILIEKLDTVGLYIYNGLVFYTMPFYTPESAHIDGLPHHTNEDWPSRSKLNYVVGESTTIWYESAAEFRKESSVLYSSLNTKYQDFSLSNCSSVYSAVLSGWHLFESGVPHAITNKTSGHRWCISLALGYDNKPGPVPFNDAKERLSKIDFNS